MLITFATFLYYGIIIFLKYQLLSAVIVFRKACAKAWVKSIARKPGEIDSITNKMKEDAV